MTKLQVGIWVGCIVMGFQSKLHSNGVCLLPFYFISFLLFFLNFSSLLKLTKLKPPEYIKINVQRIKSCIEYD